MEYKMHDLKSYRIHTIKTDKFKNCAMEIIFRKRIKKEMKCGEMDVSVTLMNLALHLKS